MSAQDVLSKYGLLAVETSGDRACIVDDETLSVTIADVRGPNAKERAEVIVAALNQRGAMAELVAADREYDEAMANVRTDFGGSSERYVRAKERRTAALQPFKESE